MRIKFGNEIIEIESFEVSHATDNERISAFLYIDGLYWQGRKTKFKQNPSWECPFGEFVLGKYSEDWLEIGEKFANEISTKMLEQGYIDLDKYDNFELY